MNLLRTIRKGRNGGARADYSHEAAASDAPGSQVTVSGSTQPLVAGFEDLKERDALARLPELAQVELTAVEAHERAHGARPAVLSKLRYLRQAEPLPGYDTLESEGVEKALSGADMKTVKAVREYERKFQHRPTALKAIASALHRSLDRPAAAPVVPPAPVEHGDQPLVEGNGLPPRPVPKAGSGATA